jgi:hypothetical protein
MAYHAISHNVIWATKILTARTRGLVPMQRIIMGKRASTIRGKAGPKGLARNRIFCPMTFREKEKGEKREKRERKEESGEKRWREKRKEKIKNQNVSPSSSVHISDLHGVSGYVQ